MNSRLARIGVMSVVLAIVLSAWLDWKLADPIVTLGAAAIMVWGAWSVWHASFDQLMDRELPDAARARIRQIVLGHGAVRSLHDLRTREAGLSTFIQVHIEMDPAMSLAEAHDVSDEVEQDLLAAYPGAEVIIHQDPARLERPPPE